MIVASAVGGVTVRCACVMPRTRPPAPSGSDIHTTALRWLTPGSQAVGGRPVSASPPLVSIATPPSATVSTPDQMLFCQPPAALAPSDPVASYQRGAPSGYRTCVPTADAQSAADSTAVEPRGRST